MRYFFILFLMSVSQFAVAQELAKNMKLKNTKEIKIVNKNEEKWVGILWREGETPIVNPILSDTQQQCIELNKEMNDITKNTVQIDRKQACQKVIYIK